MRPATAHVKMLTEDEIWSQPLSGGARNVRRLSYETYECEPFNVDFVEGVPADSFVYPSAREPTPSGHGLFQVSPPAPPQVMNRDSSPGKAGIHDKCGTLVCTICPTS